jgi:hypothetical protein
MSKTDITAKLANITEAEYAAMEKGSDAPSFAEFKAIIASKVQHGERLTVDASGLNAGAFRSGGHWAGLFHKLGCHWLESLCE